MCKNTLKCAKKYLKLDDPEQQGSNYMKLLM